MRVDPRQPLWTPSGEQGVDSATYREDQCGQREIVVQRAVNVPGERDPVIVNQTIAVPHLPYVNILDPSGNVCPVPVANNRVMRQGSVSYRTSLLHYLRTRKWVRWDYLPEGSPEFEPLQYGLTPDEWEVRRDELRRERVAATKINAEAYQPQAGDKDLAEAIKGNTEALARILDKVIAQQGGQGKRAGKTADASAE